VSLVHLSQHIQALTLASDDDTAAQDRPEDLKVRIGFRIIMVADHSFTNGIAFIFGALRILC
jgi:hypothetical protein